MGSDFDKTTSLKDFVNLPGVKGLKLPVASAFIKALKLEDEGKHTEAYAKLEEAVSIESKQA